MRVLMVCLGNICRSPMAEGILRDRIVKEKLDWSVDSAGTSDWHIGQSPHQDSITEARHHGVDIINQRARQFTVEDFDKFDLILAMDSSNYQNIIKLARNLDDENKVKIILNYAYPGMNKAVPDPYYEGGFDFVYNEMEKAIDVLIEENL